jgi:methionine synthase II (cobalamin-independent)
MITKETTIEEIIEKIPDSVKFLSEKGIRCIICGEPVWGTIYDAAKEKGFNENEIELIIKQLNEMEK